MDWWKKKKRLRDVVRKQSLTLEQVRGEMLLEELIECCDGKSNPIKFLSADQIIKAINNTCKCNIPQRILSICKCTAVPELSDYGSWRSGMLDNYRMILVKKIMYGSHSYPRKLCRDIAISSMVSGHKNFMKLVGCSLEFEYPVLVYYGAKKQYSRIDLEMVVSWRRRIKIAEEIATALAYLHTGFPRPFVYRNLYLGSILLDEDGVAKLSDFSNCVSIPQGETFVKIGYGGGVYDYMNDDYVINGVVSEKTDAFSIGILMQKLLTGEKRFRELYPWNLDWNNLEKKFPKWLSKCMGEGKMDEIVDPKILEKMGEVADEERCLMAFLILSERCIGLRGEVPKMVEVAKELKGFLRNASCFSHSGETQIISSSAFLQNQT